MDDTMEECRWFSSTLGHFVDGDFHEWPFSEYGALPTDSCNSLGEFTWLELQDLQLSGFAPSIPPEISLLRSLNGIALYFNDLEGPLNDMLPAELFAMTNMTLLDFMGNDLTGWIPSELGLLTSLTALSPNMNSLSGLLPSEFGSMMNLRTLHLWGNFLSGSLCSELGEMTSLVDLKLGGNSFSGPLPSELGKLTHLELLDLFNLTMVDGSIPSELALLINLTFLDLSGSHGLAGTMPTKLCDLQSSSCTFLDIWGYSNCTLDFDCSDVLCGCDCPCLKVTEAISVSNHTDKTSLSPRRYDLE
jgi:hypothetical protein